MKSKSKQRFLSPENARDLQRAESGRCRNLSPPSHVFSSSVLRAVDAVTPSIFIIDYQTVRRHPSIFLGSSLSSLPDRPSQNQQKWKKLKIQFFIFSIKNPSKLERESHQKGSTFWIMKTNPGRKNHSIIRLRKPCSVSEPFRIPNWSKLDGFSSLISSRSRAAGDSVMSNIAADMTWPRWKGITWENCLLGCGFTSSRKAPIYKKKVGSGLTILGQLSIDFHAVESQSCKK